jgi:thioredoxin-related protein
MKHTILGFAAAAALIIHASAAGDGWQTDYEAAKKLAADEKKDLLIDFTGSDWCGWCIRLQKEVFSQDDFKKAAKDQFVLLEVDFPQDETKLPEATRQQNKKLGEQYQVEGYPTILLCDAKGAPYASTGYEKGGAAAYVKHLENLKSQKAKRDEAFAKASQASGVEKAKGLIAALEAMELSPGTISSFYGDVVKQIQEADPKDETGFTKKANSKKKLEQLETELQGFAEKEQWDKLLEKIDATLKEGGLDEEMTLNLEMGRAGVFAQMNRIDDALKAIDEVKAKYPNHPAMEQIDSCRKQIESLKSSPAPENAPAE